MTKSAKRSLAKKLALITLIALLSVVMAFSMISAPVSGTLLRTPVAASGTDGMNGVSVKYSEAPNGMGDDNYLVSDPAVTSAAPAISTPAANEEVKVIVSLKGETMMDYASRNRITVRQAMETAGGKQNYNELATIRKNAVSSLSAYIKEYRYTYTTVLNAFSAKVKYGDIARIESDPYVKSVIISNSYLAPEAVTENYVDVYSTGIFNSSGIGYDGTGTVVAVLDTGTDYTHEVFDMELDPDELAITKDDVAAALPLLTAPSLSAENNETIDEDDLYIKTKLPFAYDYADSDANVYPKEAHGTHVAGIIAGKSDTITGVAPGAQIATFKVFSDYKTGAEKEWILAALNDAVALGVDAINMSLGSSCGFSREEDEVGVNEVYDSINRAGICLVVAASNSASSAQNSTWGNTNLSSNPDSGTIGSPATYPASLAVGSVSGVKTKYMMVDGKEIYFAESRLMGKNDPNDFVGGLLGNDLHEASFDYVVVPGIGLSVDYVGLDVTGKIAVIKRGSTSFEEKVRVAYEHGAIAAVVYNNVSGTIGMSVGTKEVMPSCFVTQEYAETMVASGQGTLTISRDYLAGPFMSDFSSWGCLPDLQLAPDITAHGGEIYSAVPGGNLYDKFSGTSMACPNLSGALILVREFVKNSHPEYITNEVRDESYSRMMSTATIIRNEEGDPYSPRKQGAGLADIASSINTKAFITVDGSNKPKLSLGHDPQRTGVYEMTFNVVNTSGSALNYTLGQYVMTESMSVDGRTVAEKAHLFYDTTNTYSAVATQGTVTCNNGSITISGYGEARVTVRIQLSAEDKAYLNKYFYNGMFVEGYIRLMSNNLDAIDLNIPYLAFYGDWTDAPMLDVTAYEVGASAVDDSILPEDKLLADVYGTIPYSGFATTASDTGIGYYGMGHFAYIPATGYEQPVPQEKYAALSTNPDGDYLLYMINAGLLRAAKRVNYQIHNVATGELVWQGVDYNARKSYASGEQVGGYVLIELDMRTLDLPNNSKYRFDMECFLDWKDENEEYTYGNKNTFSFEFTMDNEAPELTDIAVRKVKSGSTYRYYLDVSLYDNHYIQGYTIATYQELKGTERFTGYRSISGGVIPVASDYNTSTTFSYNISPYMDLIKSNGGQLYISAIDYAKNAKSFFVTIQEETDVHIAKARNASSIYEVVPNGQLDLMDSLVVTANTFDNVDEADKVYTEGYWVRDLIWESSDESIALVNNGIVTGVANGTATIKVRTAETEVFDEADTAHCVMFTVRVGGTPKKEISMTGVEMSVENIGLERGEEFTVSATIKPYNYVGTYNLVWTSTSNKVRLVSVSEDGLSATFKAYDSGSATVRATVEGSRISGYCSVRVAEEFEMTNNIYLYSYTGRGDENGVVDIPDDKGIVYIHPRAFLNNEYIREVRIPKGVQIIMRYAFYNCPKLERVVLSDTVEQIEKYAFTNCKELTSINLESVKSIGEGAFMYCEKLNNIDLSKCTYIDQLAFCYAESLTGVDLTRVGTIGGSAFAHTGLKKLVIPKNTSMSYLVMDDKQYSDSGAFAWCNDLTEVTVYGNMVGKWAFCLCENLTKVTFMGDVEIIDDRAFYMCSALTDVTFNGKVYKIGDFAFGRTAITNFTIPDGLTILGSFVFENNMSLRTVNISSGAPLTSLSMSAFTICGVQSFVVKDGNKYLSSEDGVLYDRAKKTLIAYPFYKSTYNSTLGKHVFKVPDSVVTIGNGAFSCVYFLDRVDLNNVQVIENNAFNAIMRDMLVMVDPDFGVNEIIGYDNVRYIGPYAFMGSLITELPLSNVEYIGDGAFSFCANIAEENTDIAIPSSVVYVGASAFSGTNITSVSFANSELTSVGMEAFLGCADLTTIDFGNLTSISEAMFCGCVSLETVTLTNKILSVGVDAFSGCEMLTTVVAHAGLHTIADYAFADTALAAFDMPEAVERVGAHAFENTPITAIDLSGITSVGDYAFAGTALTTVSSSSVERLGAGAFSGCEQLTTASFASATYVGDSAFEGDVLLVTVSLNGAQRVGNKAFAGCAALTAITLPEVRTVGDYAFDGDAALDSVSIAKVENIGYSFISGTAVTTISLPVTLADVTEGAFSGATALASIDLDQNNTLFCADNGVLYSVTAAGHYILICYPAGKTETTYFALEKTTKVGASAFAFNAYLEELTLPAFLSTIGDSAFYGMTALKTITLYSVTAPTLESHAFTQDREEIKYNIDGDPIIDEETGLPETEIVIDFINKYSNFPFDYGEDAAVANFRINIPANGVGYKNRIWSNYVGKYISATTVIHVSVTTLEYIERIVNVPDAPTEADREEIEMLVKLYNLFNTAQRRFISGNYDYSDNKGNAIDSEYYAQLLGGINYYNKLLEKQNKLPGASSSALTSGIQGEEVDAVKVVDGLPVAIALLATLAVIAVTAAAFTAKRRDR